MLIPWSDPLGFECIKDKTEKYSYVRESVGFKSFFYITIDNVRPGSGIQYELFLKTSNGKIIENSGLKKILSTVKTWTMYNDINLKGAASKGDYLLALKLINQGADINKGGNSTPIFMAALHGHSDVVRLLLEHGANPDGSEKETFSPLVVSSGGSFQEIGFPDIVEMLLKHGANPNKTHNGMYPLDFARASCLYEVISILEKYNAKGSEKYKNMDHCAVLK